MVYLSDMVIFHGELLNNQMVSPAKSSSNGRFSFANARPSGQNTELQRWAAWSVVGGWQRGLGKLQAHDENVVLVEPC